jgi:hypothetical protein
LEREERRGSNAPKGSIKRLETERGDNRNREKEGRETYLHS